MDDMTIGEITRSLERLEKSQSEQTVKLDEIKTQTVKTNGFVGRHEERLNGLDREVRDLKRGSQGNRHDLRRASDRKDAVTFTISRNTVVTVAIALGTFAAAMLAALMGWKLPTTP